MQNAAFLIDIDVVEFDNIKADDLGSWKAIGNEKSFFSSDIIRGSEIFSKQTCWKCVYRLPTVQLDLNFKNTRVCNCTRTVRTYKYSLCARERTGD